MFGIAGHVEKIGNGNGNGNGRDSVDRGNGNGNGNGNGRDSVDRGNGNGNGNGGNSDVRVSEIRATSGPLLHRRARLSSPELRTSPTRATRAPLRARPCARSRGLARSVGASGRARLGSARRHEWPGLAAPGYAQVRRPSGRSWGVRGPRFLGSGQPFSASVMTGSVAPLTGRSVESDGAVHRRSRYPPPKRADTPRPWPLTPRP